MGKAKDKKSKASKSTEPASTEPDPNLYFAKGEFTLPNGDSYNGDYCAHRYGLIWREGHGIYTTKDGQTYEGEWKDDKLVEQKELVIKFPNGDEYHGPLTQDKYTGPGTYTMENKMDICCEFADNKPNGNVVLIDINGRIWEGGAKENKTLLLPENHFYYSIKEDSGIGKLKSKYQEQATSEQNAEEAQEKSNQVSDREMEKIMFAKSTKTLNDIDFSQSKWFQRYLRYRTTKDKIIEKFEQRESEEGGEEAESLTDEEKTWYKKYQRYKFEQRKKKHLEKLAREKDAQMDTTHLDTYYSSKFRNSCPPMKVFYPRCDWVENYLDTLDVSEEVEEEKTNIEVAEVVIVEDKPTDKASVKNKKK